MTLGQKIKAARLERGLTQKQVVGDQITRNMLSKIENDSATPSVRTLEFLAQALGLPASYFMTDTEYSDGSSPDGLDDMRQAYRAGDYEHCLQLLDTHEVAATTDEGYLLYTRAAAALARQAYMAGNLSAAKEYADSADYYNKEGLYYSADLDTEMSLLLCQCSLLMEDDEFETNASEFLRSVSSLPFMGRFFLVKADWLLRRGALEEAESLIARDECSAPVYTAERLYVQGRLEKERGQYEKAISLLLQAEEMASDNLALLNSVYANLEFCYRELEDYKQAYHYAAKQLR